PVVVGVVQAVVHWELLVVARAIAMPATTAKAAPPIRSRWRDPRWAVWTPTGLPGASCGPSAAMAWDPVRSAAMAAAVIAVLNFAISQSPKILFRLADLCGSLRRY